MVDVSSNISLSPNGWFATGVELKLPEGSPLTEVLEMKSMTLCGLIIPEGARGTKINFFQGDESKGPFFRVRYATGEAVQLTRDNGIAGFFSLNPEDFAGIKFLFIDFADIQPIPSIIKCALKGL